MPATVRFKYQNAQGKVTDRHIELDTLAYHHKPSSERQYPTGYYLSGFDLDRGRVRRSFYLPYIIWERPFGVMSNILIDFKRLSSI